MKRILALGLVVLTVTCGGSSKPRAAAQRQQPVPYYGQQQPYAQQPQGYAPPHQQGASYTYPQQQGYAPPTPQQAPLQAQPAQAQPPAPGVDPYAALLAGVPYAAQQLQAWLAALPCPLPGLAPEIARLVDCSVLQGFRGATHAAPIAAPVGPLASSADQRAMGLIGLVRDQGEVGSCSAQAIAAILDTSAIKVGRAGTYGSAMHLFSIYQAPGNEVGLSAVARDSTSDNVWPYTAPAACAYEDESDRPSCTRAYRTNGRSAYSMQYAGSALAWADARPVFRIASPIEVLSGRGEPTNYDDLSARLAEGEPYYLSAHMPANWMSASLRGSVAPAPAGLGGPHGMVLRGFRAGAAGREFLVQNSWGSSWGEGGFLWIPERYLAAVQLAIYHLQGRIL